MLRLITAVVLARVGAELKAPGTGYSDADSCPPPETTPFGAVVTQKRRGGSVVRNTKDSTF